MGNVEECQVADEEEETTLDPMIRKESVDNAGTAEKIISTEIVMKQRDEVDNEEEHQKDPMTVILGESETEQTDHRQVATNVNEVEEEPNIKGKTILSELINEGFVENEKTESEENSKKHPLTPDEDVNKPDVADTKKSKLDEDEEDNYNSTLPEFHSEMETLDCDPGPLWKFDDRYIIELVQVGNPSKDVAYVRLKRDDDV